MEGDTTKVVKLSRHFAENVKLVASMCQRCYEECEDVKIVAVNGAFICKGVKNPVGVEVKAEHSLKLRLSFDSDDEPEEKMYDKDKFHQPKPSIPEHCKKQKHTKKVEDRIHHNAEETESKWEKTKEYAHLEPYASKYFKRKIEDTDKVGTVEENTKENQLERIWYQKYESCYINDSRHFKFKNKMEQDKEPQIIDLMIGHTKIIFTDIPPVIYCKQNNIECLLNVDIKIESSWSENYTFSVNLDRWSIYRPNTSHEPLKIVKDYDANMFLDQNKANSLSLPITVENSDFSTASEHSSDNNVTEINLHMRGSNNQRQRVGEVVRKSAAKTFWWKHTRSFRQTNKSNAVIKQNIYKKTILNSPSDKGSTMDWTPPSSPHALIEESLHKNPWALLVATIFLNKTSCFCAKPYIDTFLEDHPDALHVLSKKPEDLEPYFANLGLIKRRAMQVWKMSQDFVHKPWKRVKELYGIGKYGEDAFRMFCLGDFSVEPQDRFLRIYKAWYLMKDKEERMK